MTPRIWLRLAELLILALLAITIVESWQADRRDRAQLATQLAAAQQTIAEAAAHQKDRDAALTQTLAQIAQRKQSAVTPAQILNALPKTIALPAAITLETANADRSARAQHAAPQPTTDQADVGARFSASPSANIGEQPRNAARSETLPTNPNAKKGGAPADAIIPAADLKPLYDFALDCQACQAKLTAAQSDLSDEKTKSAALMKQRDEALRAAKGGSALRRITRAAKWFLLGAAASAIAAKATTH